MWQQYFQPQVLDDALALLARYGEGARIIAGGTDVIVELSRGIRPTSTLIDVTAIPGLRRLGLTDFAPPRLADVRYGPVAQLAEHRVYTAGVVGSRPAGPT